MSTTESVSLGVPQQRGLAATFGVLAAIWFLVLSGWLGVRPGSVIAHRQNVLFNSDSNLWVDRMVGDLKSPEQLVHPLEIALWRAPSRALYHLFGTVVSAEDARVLATRLLVALVAGSGVGFLILLALGNGIKPVQLSFLFVVYMLFTSNATLALPEHFGISSGLLTITFVIPFLITSTTLRAGLLLTMTVLCGGTTITNAVLPLGTLWHFSFRSLRLKLYLAVAATLLGIVLGLFVYTHSYTIHWFVGGYLNLRLLHDPVGAFKYMLFAIFGPVIGPLPMVLRSPGWDMVTYEPVRLGSSLRLSYSWIQVIGIACWVVLLATCIWKGFDQVRRPFVELALAWILFNALFHNIWGDDFILYAPHWSWALMAPVFLGARKLPTHFLATLAIPIVASQVETLLAIKHALQTIVQ